MEKKRVLVVDDDAVTLRLLKIGLEATGRYTVREEIQGTRACQTALEFGPDMVVLDVCMGETDGGEVASRMKNEPRLRDVPVVFLTSMVSESEASELAVTSGGYKFLSKPVKMAQLCEHIEQCLTRA